MHTHARTPIALTYYVRRHPAQTCEQIAEALGVKPSILSVTLRELRAAGKLISVGNTRGTRWRAAPDKKAKT